MFVKDVKVENQVGLHARPATFFIQKANEFKSSIWVEKEERRVNAKSLLGVLSLGQALLNNRLSTKRIKRIDILNIVGATIGRSIFLFLCMNFFKSNT